jgi:hypothetical protein
MRCIFSSEKDQIGKETEASSLGGIRRNAVLRNRERKSIFEENTY